MPFARGVKRLTYRNAAAMRKRPTEAERVLRRHLFAATRSLYRFKFQVIIAGYIADFYCASRRVAVEVDGSSHDDRKQKDEFRDAVFLKRFKIVTLRFSNEAVLSDPDRVVAQIVRFCDNCPVAKSWNAGLTKKRVRRRLAGNRVPSKAGKPSDPTP